MDEFTALAQQVAVGAGDVRGCLIVSRDGLVLGEYPVGEEAVAKPAWLRFAALGEPQKGFVEFPDQLWAYVHRGPYAAFAVAEPSVRPGLLMDRLEQALLVAEEARTRREPIRIAEGPAPSGKPRTPLHPAAPETAQERPDVTVSASPPATKEAERAGLTAEVVPPVVVGESAAQDPDAEGADEPAITAATNQPAAPEAATSDASTMPVPDATATDAGDSPSAAGSDMVAAEASAPASGSRPIDGDAPAPSAPPAPEDPAPAQAGGSEEEPQRPFSRDDTDETEVDRVLLAKEFSGLLQMDEDLDDAGS